MVYFTGFFENVFGNVILVLYFVQTEQTKPFKKIYLKLN